GCLVAHVVVHALLRLLLLRLVLAELFLRRRDDAEIMLGVLVVVLGGDRIAGALRIARELQIFFGDVPGGGADLGLGAVRFVDPGQRVLTAAILVVTAAASAATVTHALLVLTVSHCRLSHQPLIC